MGRGELFCSDINLQTVPFPGMGSYETGIGEGEMERHIFWQLSTRYLEILYRPFSQEDGQYLSKKTLRIWRSLNVFF